MRLTLCSKPEGSEYSYKKQFVKFVNSPNVEASGFPTVNFQILSRSPQAARMWNTDDGNSNISHFIAIYYVSVIWII